jgi:hypothetical protein
VPKVTTFKIWLDHARAQVSAKPPTGAALKYIAKYWDGVADLKGIRSFVEGAGYRGFCEVEISRL